MAQVKPLGKQLDIISIALDMSSNATAIGSIAAGVLADPGATASFDAEYARIDGTNSFSADLNMGNFNITNVVNVSGRNIAGDGVALDNHLADVLPHRIINDAASAVTELWSASKISTELSTKADKVALATVGNFASLDAAGNLLDSGATASTFSLSGHTHTASDITDFATTVTTELNSNSVGQLSDVDLTTQAPVSGDVLVFGTDFAPRALVEADISDLQTYELSFTKNTAFNTDFGTLVGTTCQGNDSRLSDARTPTAHTHVEANIVDLQAYILDVSGDNLETLSDVTVTTNTAGEVLKWNGTAWINNTLSEAGISPVGHSHVKADITDFSDLDYATPAQGLLADSATQPLDNVSTLTNDAGYLTAAPVTSVAGKTGVVTLVEADITDLGTYEAAFTKNTAFNTDFGTLVGTTCQGNDVRLSDARTPLAHTHVEADITDLQAYILDVSGDNLETLSDVTITTNTAGEVLKWNGTAWINNTLVEAGIATSAQGTLADSATQPLDNVSTLTNDAGYLTAAPVTSVAGKTGVVTLVEADITDLGTYAPVATPAFTGTVGFPIYTLVTLPAQAAGHQIYVSDATGGGALTGSMCFSNGTVWIDVTTGIAVA